MDAISYYIMAAHQKDAESEGKLTLLKKITSDAHGEAGNLETKEFQGHSPNISEALSHYYSAAELGCTYSMGQAAYYETNKEQALELWKVGADLGDPSAMYNLGYFEEKLQALEKALSWYTKAALAGDERAACRAAFIEQKKYPGHPCNFLAALKWCTFAIDKGCVIAMACAAKIEEKQQNFKKALEWHTKAANEGFVDSLFSAGKLEEGHFNNRKKAIVWYELGAALNEPGSMCALGCIEVDRKSFSKALDLFVKSANLGYPNAMFNAGGLEFIGFTGHPVNLEKALDWFLKAAVEGHAKAILCSQRVL